MACRTPRAWQHGTDKHSCVSRITGVMGETGSIWWNTALLLPLAFTNCHEARGRGGKKEGKKKLKRAWKRRASERSIKEGRREGLDKMNYAKLSETAIVGGAGCVRGIQRWSSAAPHGCEQPDPCSGKWSIKWGGGRRRRREGVLRWQVNCLRGTYRWRQRRSLLQLFTEVTDREIWADLHRNPGGNIITKQRNREELPFQHSTPWWLLHLRKMLRMLKSGVCMPAHL